MRSGSHFNHYDNGFYVSCKVGSESVDFLIDCGATTSLISSNKFKEIGVNRSFQLQPANVLKTVNGEQMNVTGRVDLIVEMNAEKFDIPFVVCDIDADGILGQDFLRQHVDSINYKKSCLMMGQTSVPLWVGGMANQICRVEMQQTVKIPSHSRMAISVKIPQKQHLGQLGYVEPSLDLMSKSEVCVMGGIVDTTSDTMTLNILNYGESDVTVYKNTTLGTCESHIEANTDYERIACIRETKTSSDTLPDHLVDLYERSTVHLNDLEKQGLKNLLCKYQGVFSQNAEDIGSTSLVQHSINTGNAAPIRQPPRRLPLGKRQIEREEIDKMLQRGIIEPSNSAWSSPL